MAGAHAAMSRVDLKAAADFWKSPAAPECRESCTEAEHMELHCGDCLAHVDYMQTSQVKEKWKLHQCMHCVKVTQFCRDMVMEDIKSHLDPEGRSDLESALCREDEISTLRADFPLKFLYEKWSEGQWRLPTTPEAWAIAATTVLQTLQKGAVWLGRYDVVGIEQHWHGELNSGKSECSKENHLEFHNVLKIDFVATKTLQFVKCKFCVKELEFSRAAAHAVIWSNIDEKAKKDLQGFFDEDNEKYGGQLQPFVEMAFVLTCRELRGAWNCSNWSQCALDALEFGLQKRNYAGYMSQNLEARARKPLKFKTCR